ncbi:MAG: FAD-binding domain-containing protein [Steroidobacter sp.]
MPQLTALSNRWITCPWQAPETELMDANIRLGQDYPQPIVDLSTSREAALAAYAQLKTSDP